MAVRQAADMVHTHCVGDPANDADALGQRKRWLPGHHLVQSVAVLHPRLQHEHVLRVIAHCMHSQAVPGVVLKADFGTMHADETVAGLDKWVQRFFEIKFSVFSDFSRRVAARGNNFSR